MGENVEKCGKGLSLCFPGYEKGTNGKVVTALVLVLTGIRANIQEDGLHLSHGMLHSPSELGCSEVFFAYASSLALYLQELFAYMCGYIAQVH